MGKRRIWKDGLLQGTFVTPKGQVFHCGPEEAEYYYTRTKARLSKGSPLPWVWEHQHTSAEDTKSLSANDLLAEWAKNTGGHVHDVRKLPDHTVEFLIDVDDEIRGQDGKTDKERLEAIKFVSPDLRMNWRERTGPATDEIGPYWPGMSIAHLAVTPLPVQYPQSAFDFGKNAVQVMSLSAAGMDICLSGAMIRVADGNTALSAKTDTEDDNMPFPPDKDKENPDEVAANEQETETAQDAENPDISEGSGEQVEPGEDLEGGGPITDDMPIVPTVGAGAGATGAEDADEAVEAAAAMAELEQELGELGIEFHGSASDDLLNFIQHLNTAIKTHKGTKAGGMGDQNLNEPDLNDPNSQANQQKQNKQQQQPYNPNNPQEPEIAERAPIMMSAKTPPTPREIALAKKLVKSSNDGLRARIGNLHTQGYIDDGIKAELLGEISNIKLSMADLSDDGDLKPTTVSIRVEAYERLARTKKPGSFVRPKASPAPASGSPNPLKPISSTVSLSSVNDDEIILEAPEGGGVNMGAEASLADPEVQRRIDKMSGGKYLGKNGYLARKASEEN